MKLTPHELFRESEILKASLLTNDGDTIPTKEIMLKRNELRHLLELLLLTDLDYALDKKVEKDLWNIVFRNPITNFQNKVREQKTVTSHSLVNQSQLAVLLESASGFYLQLLQKLACANDIDLLCHPRDSNFGLISDWQVPVVANKSSVLYICQYCLVHLGDIARYRGQSLQAETFYRHAVELIPSNGQPYNQLALLEAASGEKLSTVFFYIRSLTVQHPFPLAATNLQKQYIKMITDGNPDSKSRMSAYEYISAFLQFQALVHLGTDFPKAERVMSQLTSSLPALIIAEKLETWQLIQMAAVAMFAVGHASNQFDVDGKGELSADEQRSRSLMLEMIANMLNAFLLPIHAVLDPQESRDYYSVPAVKVLFDWLLLNHKVLEEEIFVKRPQIWQGLCKLLNDVDDKLRDLSQFEDVPLPEDWDLQCFLPLVKTHRELNFHNQNFALLEDDIGALRAHRLSQAAMNLCQLDIGGKKVMTLTTAEDGTTRFAPVQPGILTEQVLQQIQELTIAHESGASEKTTPLAAKVSSVESATPRSGKVSVQEQPAQEVRFKLDEEHHRKEVEKEVEVPRIIKEPPVGKQKERRVARQNVAMQAILQQRAAQNLNFIQPKDTSQNIQVVGVEQRNMHQMIPTPQQQPTLIRSMAPDHIQDCPKPSEVPSQRVDQEEKGNVWMQPYSIMPPSMPPNHLPVARAPTYIPPSHHFPGTPMEMSFHPQQYGQRTLQPPQQQHAASAQTNKPIQPYVSNPGVMWNYMSYMPQTVQQPGAPPLLVGPQQQQNQQPAYMMMPQHASESVMQNERHVDYSTMLGRTWQRENVGAERGQMPYHYNFLPGPSQVAANQMNMQQAMDGASHLAVMNPKGQNTSSQNQLPSDLGASTYSLFSSPWSSGLTVPCAIKESSRTGGGSSGVIDPIMMQPRIQSLWSGPGPSPLERLLEQQKQRRDAANH